MVHGIEGLYVADASALPSAGAVNTGLTIVALALRTGDAIAHKAAGSPHTKASLFSAESVVKSPAIQAVPTA
jgi:choline dehydrogenase-like flavoprotein